jgi:hypothetical protein
MPWELGAATSDLVIQSLEVAVLWRLGQRIGVIGAYGIGRRRRP